MLQSLLGKIRVPRRAKLELDGSEANLKVAFEAENYDGTTVQFHREYPGLLLPIQLVLDLRDWLKYTAQTFYRGDPTGGL